MANRCWSYLDCVTVASTPLSFSVNYLGVDIKSGVMYDGAELGMILYDMVNCSLVSILIDRNTVQWQCKPARA